MDRYTKAQKKRLRQLRDTAYEHELDHELEKLYRNFKKWRNREIDGFKLNDLIHKHHQGTSRELWKFYSYADPDTAVARAVKLDFIKKEEIPDDILKLITPRFDLFRDNEP
jgi:hypothetical protein